MIWILALVALTAFLYLVAIKPTKYWSDRGVIQGTPYPLVGDSWDNILQFKSVVNLVKHGYYKTAPNSRYAGIYQFRVPTLVLRDPALIKQITVRDFDYFVDHSEFIPANGDPLWGQNLFSLKGQKWRDMRSTLSPAFTGSKMKQMFGLMTDIGDQFVKHFLNKNKDVVTVEMKDTCTRFANDVIASTAFGVECDSLEERDNEFYTMGKRAIDFTGIWTNMKIFGSLFAPKVVEFFKLSIFDKAIGDFFTNLVIGNIKQREEQGIIRPDLINILMEARSKGLKYEENGDAGSDSKIVREPLTDIDISAQALLFFFAGFDSVSSHMCFISHELAVNPDIQERLRREVDQVDKECGGKLTYEALSSMKYMTMVTSEALRKWPNAAVADRVCTKPYTIKAQSPEEKDIEIEVGTLLWLPIFGLHRDEKYFPDPERFDPERFSDENKHKIVPCSYLPFGVGQRNCIGYRFAHMETKTLFFYILRHFEIIPVRNTQTTLELYSKRLGMTAKGGFWVGLKKRNKA